MAKDFIKIEISNEALIEKEKEGFDKEALQLFEKRGFYLGRCLGSKSLYEEKNPTHIVYFNANILCRPRGKIWYGDIDLSQEDWILEEIAEELGEELFLVPEPFARFGRQDELIKQVLNFAVWSSKKGFLE